MHLAQGLLKAHIVNKLTDNGVHFIFWIADWFAFMNKKLGGDLEKIQTCGRYMIEIWKACGMKLQNVEFVWSSKEIISRAQEYWNLVLDISTKSTISRVTRCSPALGREITTSSPASNLLYPIMQCADVFFLNVDICQLGTDQRKVNMLAREYSEKSSQAKKMPIILSHAMVMGLLKDGGKMSKSKQGSAIFMEDTKAEVDRKINHAFCPPPLDTDYSVDDNPILDWCKKLVFVFKDELKVKGVFVEGRWDTETESATPTATPPETKEEIFTNYADLEKRYVDGKIPPNSLKAAVAEFINGMLQPVRDHFNSTPELKQLAETVKHFRLTR